MSTDRRAELQKIRTFSSLVRYLRDELDWPISTTNFEDLTFEYAPEELGIDAANAAKIDEIKRLRPLHPSQPWGIFFVKFEPKRLPVVALRRILSQVALRKRASANRAERQAWEVEDLLFISSYGEGDDRHISFAHFREDRELGNLAALHVLGWDAQDTGLHMDNVVETLTTKLTWPEDQSDPDAWRERWRSAFTIHHREVITTSVALARRLASLARGIRAEVEQALEIETESGRLRTLLKAFREALLHDLDESGFADMYAQTVAYGLLSARVSRQSGELVAGDAASFVPITNPFLREMMETFVHAGELGSSGEGVLLDFDEVGINEVVQTLRATNMEAVLRDFGDKNPDEDPVIHFYEDFLREYDKKQKVSRGVFYTPRPVVSYIVRSVDELLRTEFSLEDGLADTTTWAEMSARRSDLSVPPDIDPDEPFVQILDPAAGTGTFLVEVIDRIYETMTARWSADRRSRHEIDELWNKYVPQHLLPRLFGYELLMAPYAIAHLKVGLKLMETGYRFASEARARIYLTNALEPAGDFAGQFAAMSPALAHEADAVNTVKQNTRFTVVVGNPPYAGISSNVGDWIQGLARHYYTMDGQPLGERNLKWLLDDYVKFFRLAETSVESSGYGVLGFITNHGYLANPTFRGMRRSLLETFDAIDVLDLHGNQNRREESPGGTVDENVFDIQQGVAIALLRRTPSGERNSPGLVNHADLWGGRVEKYQSLVRRMVGSTESHAVLPRTEFWLFVPQDEELSLEYEQFRGIDDLFLIGGVGMTTARDHAVIDFERGPLLARLAEYQRFQGSDVEFCEFVGISEKKGWDIARSRRQLRAADLERSIVPVAYRPFDDRQIFYDDSLVWRTVKQVMGHMLAGENIALITARSNKSQSMDHFYCTRLIMETKCGEATTQSCLFPLYRYSQPGELGLGPQKIANLSPDFALPWMLRLRANVSVDVTPEAVFGYAYAIFHSPTYRNRYAQFLKIDFPRLPLTTNGALFEELAALGTEVAQLHVLESSLVDEATGRYKGPKNPAVGGIGWSNGTVWIDAQKTDARSGQLATKPGTMGFCAVPKAVWDFRIGGYQVLHKWLKDRAGRTLSGRDIAHYQRIVVSLRETIRLMNEIDEVIEAHGGWPAAFRAQDLA